MPKHDENRYTAFNAGQMDSLQGYDCDPASHHIHDEYRRNMYLAGYSFEIKEAIAVQGEAA